MSNYLEKIIDRTEKFLEEDRAKSKYMSEFAELEGLNTEELRGILERLIEEDETEDYKEVIDEVNELIENGLAYFDIQIVVRLVEEKTKELSDELEDMLSILQYQREWAEEVYFDSEYWYIDKYELSSVFDSEELLEVLDGEDLRRDWDGVERDIYGRYTVIENFEDRLDEFYDEADVEECVLNGDLDSQSAKNTYDIKYNLDEWLEVEEYLEEEFLND